MYLMDVISVGLLIVLVGIIVSIIVKINKNIQFDKKHNLHIRKNAKFIKTHSRMNV